MTDHELTASFESLKPLDVVFSMREVHLEDVRIWIERKPMDIPLRMYPADTYYRSEKMTAFRTIPGQIGPFWSFEASLRQACGCPDTLGFGKLLKGVLTGADGYTEDRVEAEEWPLGGVVVDYTGL